ncbi:probable apyrase 7 isoform X1 [Lactuca sativa]|uniref:Apyrase n=1 Tax=Lactuca sativa TaxID=4236 RepID=A0A9R1VU35_LACSA|nr:probable apyrase 7 isoform X1 [Lactuca sativa]KAJ0210915.1 hypothetical protein LSAT_V11C400187530 [Lactuca sativa]
MEPKSPSKAKLPILGFFHHFRVLKSGIVIVVVVLLLLILIGYYYLIRNPRFPTYFTVVIDCGSSGTRVNIYEWMWMSNRNPELPILLHSFPDNSTKNHDRKHGCAYHCMQTEPGLDQFVGNSSGVRASLEPLIRRAEKWVPYERHIATPIFVLATAGLRRLGENMASRVLDDVEGVVRSHKFNYRKDWIRVLSGREEAYYGWIALNYHMGVFKNSSSLPTLGLLDLGGSSLQVATEIKEPTAGVFRSNIGSFEIFADSLPDFGLNEAFDRTVVMLSHSHSRKGDLGIYEIGHPCLGDGFMQNYTCHGCMENKISSLHLFGEPNWEKCKELARAAAINSKLNREKMVSLIGGSHSVARFHALSGFFAVYNLLNLNAEEANVSNIWEKGEKLCSRSLTGLTLTNMGINQNQKYADFLCFRVPYMVSVIENVVCVGDKDIIFGPGDVSWTLGAALVEGKDLWGIDTSKAKSISIFSYFRFKRLIFSPYFVFFILVILLFVVYRSQIKLPMLGRKPRQHYSFGPKRRPV